jgi:hypothetical protein
LIRILNNKIKYYIFDKKYYNLGDYILYKYRKMITDKKEIKGHILVIGATNTGKTYFTKRLLNYLNYNEDNTRVYCNEISKEQWDEYETLDIWTNESFEDIKKFGKENKQKGSIVIFDDFWNNVNMSHNKDFGSLLRTIRHYNVRIIIIVHTIGDVPSSVRENVSHCFSTYITNNHLRKELATTFFSGDMTHLIENLEQCKGNYNLIHIDKIKSDINIINAKDLDEEDSDEEPENKQIDAINTRDEISVDASKKVTNNGLYNDMSVTNNQIKIDADLQKTITLNKTNLDYKIEQSNVQNKIEIEKYYHVQQLNEIKGKDETKMLLYKNIKSNDDEIKLVENLAYFLKDSNITQQNYSRNKKDELFMQMYFPEHNYRSKREDLLDKLAVQAVDYNTKGLLLTCWKEARSTNLVKDALTNFNSSNFIELLFEEYDFTKPKKATSLSKLQKYYQVTVTEYNFNYLAFKLLYKKDNTRAEKILVDKILKDYNYYSTPNDYQLAILELIFPKVTGDNFQVHLFKVVSKYNSNKCKSMLFKLCKEQMMPEHILFTMHKVLQPDLTYDQFIKINNEFFKKSKV